MTVRGILIAFALFMLFLWTLTNPNIQAKRMRACVNDAQDYLLAHPDFTGGIVCKGPFLW